MNKKKIMFFALGPVFSGILGSLTLPAISWLFSKEDIGRITMLQIVCSFCTLLFSLGLDQAYVREYHETKRKSSLLFLVLFPGLFLLLLSIFICLPYNTLIENFIYERNGGNLFLFTVLSVVSVYISRFFALVLRMQEKALSYSISQFAPKLAFFIIILCFWRLSFPRNLYNLVFAHFLSISTTFVTLALLIKSDLLTIFSEEIQWKDLKGLLSFGFPLILGGVAFWGLSAMSRISLRNLSSYSELGTYSVALSAAGVASLLQGVFSTVWSPVVYKWASQGEKLEKIDRIMEYVLAFVVFTFSICGMTSWLIPKLLPRDYYSVQFIFIACLGQPLLYTLSEVTVVGICLARKTFYSMLAPLLAGLVNFGLCNLFIPFYGARGAAIATYFAFLVFFVVRTEGSVWVWRDIPRMKMYCFLAVISVFTVFSVLWGEKFFILSLLFWFVLFIFSAYHFREIICNLIKKISLSSKN